MIIGLQVIAFIFVIIMSYFTYLHYRRKELNGLEVIVMFLAWLGASLIVFFPSVFNAFSGAIAVSRAFDLAVVGGFIFVIPLVYLSYIKVKRMEKKVEDYVRKEALEKLDHESKKRPTS